MAGFVVLLFLINVYLAGPDGLPAHFFDRMARASFLGFAVSFLYIFIAARVILYFNKQKLDRSSWKRWVAEFLVIVGVSLSLASILIQVAPPPPGTEEVQTILRPITIIFFFNFLLGIIVFAIVELWNIYEENRDLQLSLANAEKEKVTLQLSALQQKINPHFLFNSLSVLSELTYEDPKKANAFIREFAKIYRYVLEVNDEVVVTVKQELEFLNAYLFLQKIRFGDNLVIDQKIDPEVLHAHIPPLSLQLLFENAIKHNQISKIKPLHIQLKNSNGHLVVINNLQLRNEVSHSGGVGLSSLKKTYHLISDKEPEFHQTQDDFVAKIPLIQTQDDA
jgi:two-component system LytT family sensor kinase